MKRATGRRSVLIVAAAFHMGVVPLWAQQGQRAVTPVSLEAALERALMSNRDLQTARLDLGSAQKRVKEAWGSVFPTLDMNTSYTRSLSVPANFLPRIIFDPEADPDELVAVKFGADNAWSFQLRAEQPLFEASAFIGVGAASRYESLQEEVIRGRTIDVATRVKLAYYDALLAQEAVRLAENTVKRVRLTLDETRKMFEAGISSSYDVLRLEVELSNLEPQLRRSQNAALAAHRKLAVELSLQDLDAMAVAGSLFDFDPEADVVTGAGTAQVVQREDGPGSAAEQAVTVALERRSDLRQLQ